MHDGRNGGRLPALTPPNGGRGNSRAHALSRTPMRPVPWLACAGVLVACTPHPASTPTPEAEDWQFYLPPEDAIGRAGDRIVTASASAQWVAVCRGDLDFGLEARLLVGDTLDISIDHLLAEDATGRWVVFDRDCERVLYDAVLQRETVLGSASALTPGSFGGEPRTLVYGERGETEDRVVVRDLVAGTSWSFVSPIRSLTNVELAGDAEHVWLTAYDSAPSCWGGNMCDLGVSCAFDIGKGHTGSVLAVLGEGEPTFVEIEQHSIPYIAIGREAVMQEPDRIDLVGPSGRRTIVEGECRVEHHDATSLVIKCVDDDRQHRWWQWQAGVLAAIDFRSHEDVPPPDAITLDVARGVEGSWYSLPARTVVQGLAAHDQGHAWRDRIALVGPRVGVQIHDAETGFVVHHDIDARARAMNGPFLAVESRDYGRTDGWVIDLRSGDIRGYPGPIVALSRSGHVASHGTVDGRLRWR